MQSGSSLRRFLVELSRPSKQLTMVCIDICAYSVCSICTAWILIGEEFFFSDLYLIAFTAVIVSIPLGWFLGLYETIVRYIDIGTEFFVRANFTAGSSAILVSTLSFASNLQNMPYRLAVTFWALALLYICLSRYSSRLFLSSYRREDDLERVLIYGAGSAGAQLVGCLQLSQSVFPVAFIDDDLSLSGKRVKGLKVYRPSQLEKLVTKEKISRVMLALPRVSRRRRRMILEQVEKFVSRVQTIPDFNDLVSGDSRVDDIRDMSIADLMGRKAVPPNPELLHASVEEKNVMITGAGGSIGSELCRQIIMLKASRIVLFDNAEISLYRIERELQNLLEYHCLDCEIVSLLGSVSDFQRVDDVIRTFNIQTIYHAAAYKHVPIVEQNLIEGIQNNAIGTMQLANAACNAGVEIFVLVSTDKAVRPANAMGATKRAAELVLQAMQENFPNTRLCMVRFGNVLDSSGSVVPLFREQIKKGGPVTVTHRDIVRYFMTIPEAAELVIQAGSMARGGDIFVLDMGEPIRIQDLAKRMIQLMGLSVCDKSNPDGDIEIAYTGLRPAEKLYEELMIGDEVFGTEHPCIMRVVEPHESYKVLIDKFNYLAESVFNQDCEDARELLFEIVSGYEPLSGINDLVWVKKTNKRDQGIDRKVTKLVTG
ncbi:MAG: nucleoside-diphosphate sugar epimerase/dehydratase [Pseudomonadota bacterium]|nr:nucleoside-diphosphate sugar epimerase/dehydratase [Pseudomonadota bacterium]